MSRENGLRDTEGFVRNAVGGTKTDVRVCSIAEGAPILGGIGPTGTYTKKQGPVRVVATSRTASPVCAA